MKQTLVVALVSTTLLTLASSASAAGPLEILRCQSGSKTLSVLKSKNQYTLSLTQPLTQEAIQATVPGVTLSEEMRKLMESAKPENSIPADVRGYRALKMTDAVVKNGFLLTDGITTFDFIQSEEGSIALRFRTVTVSGGTRESATRSLPFGPVNAVECTVLVEPK